MLKRFVSIFTVTIMIMAMIFIVPVKKVQAYSNNSYFNDLKVGLMSMSSASMSLSLNGDYLVNGKVYASGSILSLSISGTSIMLNGTALSTLEIIPKESSNLLSITSNSITNKYMGSFTVKIYNSKLLLVNSIFMEDYLKGVVGYEMSDYFPVEALKAQAVAARNYAISRLGFEAAKGYDFDDTINYQVYKGYNDTYKNVIRAVDETRGQVLLYNDSLVETLYSAWHGGISENSENVWSSVVPYLRSVQDPYESDPWPNGSRVLTNAQIQSTLITKKYLTLTDAFVKLDLSSITKFPSGRIQNINIIYKDSLGILKTKSVTKDNARTFLSLPSSLYNVTYDSIGGAYTFTGKGNGHGLGMSQIGAKNRAAAGQTYDTILKFYYQNTYIQNLISKASISSLSLSSSNLFLGDTISFNINAAGSSNILYKYIIKNGPNIVYNSDFLNSSTLSFIPVSSGSYSVEAYAKDKFSLSDYDDMKISSFTVFDKLSMVSFNLNKNEALVSQNISATTTAANGSGSYLYKYEVSKDGSIINTKDFTGDNSFNFTPLNAGVYTITSYIKDSLSQNEYDAKDTRTLTVYDAFNITSFTKNITNVFAGDTVNFTAASSGGSGTASYKFVVIKDGSNVYTGSFAAANNFSYTFTDGNYDVYVYGSDKASSNSIDAVSKMSFAVFNPSITKVTASGYFYNLKAVNFTAEALGGSPSGLSYKYEIYKDGSLISSNSYIGQNTFSFTPSLDGTYNVKVYVKDALSSKTYDAMKDFNITVNANPLYLSVLPLKYGMTNTSVAALQDALIKLNYTIKDTKGYFGKSTQSAVISFQGANNLTKDGIVGTMSYNALNNALIIKSGIKTITY